MTGIVNWMAILFAFLSAGIICFKAYKKQDLSLLSGVIARIILASTGLHLVYNPTTLSHNMFHVAMGFVLVADVFVNAFYFINPAGSKQREYRRILATLDHLREKYSLLIENVPTGIYVIDGNGRIEFVNAELATMLGYTRPELLGSSVYDLICEEDRELARKNIDKRIRGEEKTITYSVRALKKDGSLIRVRLIGSRTENGHVTITGSMTPYEGVGGC